MADTINGRTPEVIKKWLECCQYSSKKDRDCDVCPYHPADDCYCYENEALTDTLAYIQQLERERDEARNDLDTISYANTELSSAYDAMKRERDAAVEDLEEMGNARAYCDTCFYANSNSKEEPCSSCMSGYLINNWQWRGVQEV